MESRRETGRLEGFSDAVFAIAITLLALDLKVPPAGGPRLLSKVASGWPDYLAFLASFGAIGVMWVLHHRLFSLIKRVDGTIFLFNLLVLLGVVTVPFWTAVTVAYARGPDKETAALLHGGTFVMITIFLNLLWRHALSHQLLDETVAPHAAHYLGHLLSLAPVLYLVSLCVAYISVAASSTFNTVVALFFLLK